MALPKQFRPLFASTPLMLATAMLFASALWLRRASLQHDMTQGSVGLLLTLASALLLYRVACRTRGCATTITSGETHALADSQWAQIALASLDDGVVTTDAQGCIEYLNAVAVDMSGWTLVQARGRPLGEIFLLSREDSATWVADALSRLRTTPGTADRLLGLVHIKRGGQPITVNWSLFPIRDGDGVATGFAGVARDITERKNMGQELERKNSILLTQQESSLDAILLVDEHAKIVSYNRQFVQMWNLSEELTRSNDDAPVLQKVITQVENPAAVIERVKYLYAHKQEQSREVLRTIDGRTIDRFTAPVVSPDGESFGRVWYFRDITERERMDASLRRANRALRVISTVNETLIHDESESKLLDHVCRALVELGGYRMAWVGFAEQDEYKSVRPVAQHGYEDGYLARIAVSWADVERGHGPTGAAARTGTVQICRDIASDPRMRTWRADALKCGYASAISLPLSDGERTFGVLSIYSRDTDAFDEEEVALLQELSANLSFGTVTHRSNLERRRAEARAEHLANYDALTALPNRVQLIAHLDEAIECARSRGEHLALMTLGIDRFSEIQEGIGIAGADDLLKKVTQRLGAAAAVENFTARISDESFAIVIPQGDSDRAHEIAKRIQSAMSNPFEYAGIPLDVRATSGIALFPVHGANPDALIRRSDIALRRARAAGIEYALYSGRGETESPQRLMLLAELRKSIKDNDLLLYYQPKIDVREGRISAVEALVRWPHPERGMIPPKDFIPQAEQTGLIKPITQWVLEAAWKQIMHWQRLGIEIPIAVNVSPNNLRDPAFLGKLVELHAEEGARMDLMQVEVTETALMEDPDASREVLLRMRDLGIQIFLDDFGTGYSSLSYIAALPIHALKIDRSFVLRMMRNKRHRAVVVASISLAHSLGLKVVAEGIETADQAKTLIELDCDEIQGYLFSMPLAADEFLRWRTGFDWAAYGLQPTAESILLAKAAG
jgi:diguanylate cyclase (GGDEF)-like protein/PAS domain S-box-containing protein